MPGQGQGHEKDRGQGHEKHDHDEETPEQLPVESNQEGETSPSPQDQIGGGE